MDYIYEVFTQMNKDDLEKKSLKEEKVSLKEGTSASHLEELIKQLNSPLDIDGEEFESEFNFELKEEDGTLFLYDTKENYTINYEEDQYYMYQEFVAEFGGRMPEVLDKITPQIIEAVKADFGKDAYVEWENNVRMIIVKDNPISEAFKGDFEDFEDYAEENLPHEARYKDTHMNPKNKKLFWLAQENIYEDEARKIARLFCKYFKEESEGKQYDLTVSSRDYGNKFQITFKSIGGKCKIIKIKENNESLNNKLEETIEKHDVLNPLLWDENKELKPEIKEKIKAIVDYFVDNLKEDNIKFNIKDIVILGSNCSYNYNPDSDLDVHIIADSKELECPDDLYTVVYSAYRSIFNNKYDIMIKGIPVELYIEMDEVKNASKGVYSLNTGWIKEPVQEEIPDIDQEEFDKEFKKWENRYLNIIKDEEVPEGELVQDIIEEEPMVSTPEEEIQENLKEEFMTVSEDSLKDLELKFSEAGFEITSKKEYLDWFSENTKTIHYQILSKEGNQTKETFDEKIEIIDKILDDFEDITGSPCTFNMGLQKDGFISAGIDCRPIYYKPGEDFIPTKPTTLKFRDGEPADDDTKAELKAISDKMGQDVSSFIPLDKKKYESMSNESLESSKIEEIEAFIKDVYDLRKSSIAEEGEYGIGNLVFKELRNLDYINNLKLLKIDLKTKELSLEQLEESLLQDYSFIHRDLVKRYGEKFYDYIDEYLSIPEIAKTEDYSKIIFTKEGWEKFISWCNKNKGTNYKTINDSSYLDQLEEAKKKKDKYYQHKQHWGLPAFITKPSFWKTYDEIEKEATITTTPTTPTIVATSTDVPVSGDNSGPTSQ